MKIEWKIVRPEGLVACGTSLSVADALASIDANLTAAGLRESHDVAVVMVTEPSEAMKAEVRARHEEEAMMMSQLAAAIDSIKLGPEPAPKDWN
jgi:hypothetical protein